jgi:hypothetical protein
VGETREIIIESESHDAPELKALLAQELSDGEGIALEQRSQEAEYRLDPTIVVAMITGGASVLVSLITALATVAATRAKQAPPSKETRATDAVQVFGPRGDFLLEVPAGTPAVDVERNVRAIGSREVSRILLVRIDR